MKKVYWIALLVAISNYWFWRMIKLDLLIAILSLGLSLFLSVIIISKKPERLLYYILVVVSFLSISIITLKKGSDKGIFITQPLERDLIEKRHEYLAKGLGKVYRNRIGIFYLKTFQPSFYRLQKNLFSNLDLNLFFFKNHPRERVGIDEFNKYPVVLLPFFFVGLLFFLKEGSRVLLIYLISASFVSTFLHPIYNLGPVLFYPFVNVAISYGAMRSGILIPKTIHLKIKQSYK